MNFSHIHPDLTPGFFILFLVAALILGMSKAGLSGFGLTAVPLMALIFGAKESTGVILPMLITADIMAVLYWRRHAVWKHIVLVLPWVAVGIVTALITGNSINDDQFRILLLTIVWIMLILMVVNDLRKKDENHVPHSRIFSILMGFTGGFATMIGNAAGPVFTLYFLSMRLPKKEFIGTSAWLYFIMNTGKLPLQVLVWKNITVASLIPGLVAIPVIALGIWLGIRIVHLFPENVYRYFVIVTTIATSLLLFI
ncbi:MAG TPA: sulfite exporter TauE/SafE family protein [Lentimicrobium sp.]|nr:sulfite exporter TauE/SafE family protein [Lentimicrobium sp.]